MKEADWGSGGRGRNPLKGLKGAPNKSTPIFGNPPDLTMLGMVLRRSATAQPGECRELLCLLLTMSILEVSTLDRHLTCLANFSDMSRTGFRV